MVLELGNGPEESDTMMQWGIDCLEENCLREVMPHSRGKPTTRTEVKAVIPQGNSDGPSAPVPRHQDCQVPPISLPQGHFLVDFHGSQWASQRGHWVR